MPKHQLLSITKIQIKPRPENEVTRCISELMVIQAAVTELMVIQAGSAAHQPLLCLEVSEPEVSKKYSLNVDLPISSLTNNLSKWCGL
jgi:hypothetical protein